MNNHIETDEEELWITPYELEQILKISRKVIIQKIKKGLILAEISEDKKAKYRIPVTGEIKDQIIQYRKNKKKEKELLKSENKKINVTLKIDRKTILDYSLHEILALMDLGQKEIELNIELPRTRILNLLKKNKKKDFKFLP